MTAPITPPVSSKPLAQRHPRGLYILFFTEMWERFSYYGMRALLVLFMVDAVRNGGMGLSDEIATSIYGLYTAAVFLAALPGGWLADRFFGAHKCVWFGGIIIAMGHFVLAIPRTETFYLGLIFVVLGTGLLKPNISAIVGGLYPQGGAQRDAGFTIFYMGINLGAALGPLVCSQLAKSWNWHSGFIAAGFGMVLGLIQFRLSKQQLGDIGTRPEQNKTMSTLERSILLSAILLILILIVIVLTGIIRINPITLARGSTVFIVAIAIFYFGYALFFGGLDKIERQRVVVILVLFIAAALFWAGFEQVGSTFNLFAERYTLRRLGWLNYEIPAGWFQSLGPAFIITLAPLMAALWVALARRNLNPSIPVKFGLALLLLAAGLFVMAAGAKLVTTGQKVWPTWLITTYLLHTLGELCLSPVGLSSVTKLAPRRLVGQMMGVWFLAASLGNLLAGLIAGGFKADDVAQMPIRYLQITVVPVLAGVLLILLANPIKRWAQEMAPSPDQGK